MRRAIGAAVALKGRLGHVRPSRPYVLALDLLLIASTCGLLWGGIGLLLHQQREDLLRDAVHDTSNLSRAVQENTVRTVDAIDRTLLFLRAAYQADPSHFDLISWNRGIQALDDLTLQVSLVDKTGQAIASNLGPVRPGTSIADREHFQVQLSSARDDLFISKPILGRESGKWSIQFTRKLLAADGSFAGVAVISVDPFSLARFYASFDIGHGSVMLAGLDGVIRAAAPVDGGMLGRDISLSPVFVAARKAPTGTLEVAGEAGASRQVVGFRRIDRYGLVGVVGLNRAEVLIGYARSRNEYLAGGGFFTLLILLVGSSVVIRRQVLLRTQEQLMRSQLVLTDTLENMSQGIFMVDAERKFAVINNRAKELLGLPPKLIAPGVQFDDLLLWQISQGEFDGDEATRKLAESGGLELTDAVYERTRPSGITLEVRTRRLLNGRALRTFTDVTERKRAEAHITYLAHHDALTGLANRAFFHERLAHAISVSRRGGAPFAVICLDLDRFKQVNDARGHDVGDRLLQAVAERLRASVREGDTVARFGGDEFAILQAEVGQPGAAAALAERLVTHLADPYPLDGVQLSIGASAGVALHPADGLSVDQLLKSADIALYKAKEDGRGMFCFFESAMDAAQQQRYALERDLREALADGRIEVRFAPVSDADSGRLVAFEALPHWTHPDRGPIAPQVFLPLAEETGQMAALGRTILREACRGASEWPRDVRVTVNLSPQQFLEPELADDVLQLLADTGLDPRRFGLEVTEGALIRHGPEALATMQKLQRAGVRVYLDHFGTGHAGLNHLLRFPFDGIKIDPACVGPVIADKAAETVVRTAVLLGACLKLEVVASGVETEAQRARLAELGCHLVQGCLIGEPRPASDVAGERVRLSPTESVPAAAI